RTGRVSDCASANRGTALYNAVAGTQLYSSLIQKELKTTGHDDHEVERGRAKHLEARASLPRNIRTNSPSGGGNSPTGEAIGSTRVSSSSTDVRLSHWTGVRIGAPLSFTRKTTKRAGAVRLAFRLTRCTSSGPS